MARKCRPECEDENCRGECNDPDGPDYDSETKHSDKRDDNDSNDEPQPSDRRRSYYFVPKSIVHLIYLLATLVGSGGAFGAYRVAAEAMPSQAQTDVKTEIAILKERLANIEKTTSEHISRIDKNTEQINRKLDELNGAISRR